METMMTNNDDARVTAALNVLGISMVSVSMFEATRNRGKVVAFLNAFNNGRFLRMGQHRFMGAEAAEDAYIFHGTAGVKDAMRRHGFTVEPLGVQEGACSYAARVSRVGLQVVADDRYEAIAADRIATTLGR